MKILTAEEFLNSKQFMRSDLQCETNYQLIIEFAKLHVESALKEASGKACSPFYKCSKHSILNSYPLTNIK